MQLFVEMVKKLHGLDVIRHDSIKDFQQAIRFY